MVLEMQIKKDWGQEVDKVEGSGGLLALVETAGMAANNFPSIRL